jgi:hypothetical protein
MAGFHNGNSYCRYFCFFTKNHFVSPLKHLIKSRQTETQNKQIAWKLRVLAMKDEFGRKDLKILQEKKRR